MMKCFLFILVLLLPLHVSGKRINESRAVKINGIKQWIKLQGENDKAPLLLFLHGGPGNSVMGYADKFTKELQKQFVIVHWDQRESGQTALLNKSAESLTVALFIADAIAIINYLRSRYSRDKIYLMGHSWGGYLGLRVTMERPDLLFGYFAISPMIKQLESERLSLLALKVRANHDNNTEALSELDKVTIPFQNGEQLFYHRKWLSKLMKSTLPTKARVDQWATTWLNLFNEASQTDLAEQAPVLHCPVYFLIGRNDYQTHYSLAESYYQKVVCKEKKLYWFEDSAHNPHLTETSKFQEIVMGIKNQN